MHRLLQYSTDCVVKCSRDLNRKLGIKFTLSEPMVSKNLLSKRQFLEFFVPYLRQCVEQGRRLQYSAGRRVCRAG